MGTERLIVKNFGPIVDIDIEVKDVNVLIGTTGSGKSTVAKLLTIFRSVEFLLSPDHTSGFQTRLRNLNINYNYEPDSIIHYKIGGLEIIFEGGRITSNFHLPEFLLLLFQNRKAISGMLEGMDSKSLYSISTLLFLVDHIQSNSSLESLRKDFPWLNINPEDPLVLFLKDFNVLSEADKGAELSRIYNKYGVISQLSYPTYFPAERLLISMVGSSIMGILKHDVVIADCVKEFGTAFENARKQIGTVAIDFLELSFRFENNENLVSISGRENIPLEKTSSGIQSILPLMIVLEFIKLRNDNGYRKFLVIEEPELNLYPNTQKNLVEYLIKVVNGTDSKLFITTHSPYILTSLDNLVQAHNAYKAHPEKEAEIEKIIPKSQWLDFDNVSCYFFDKGTCKSTLNHELRTLGSSAIDDVSIEIGKEFDLLTDIQYA
jgi:energy-coupling factor transporter ATP-binding protein EcfA2